MDLTAALRNRFRLLPVTRAVQRLCGGARQLLVLALLCLSAASLAADAGAKAEAGHNLTYLVTAFAAQPYQVSPVQSGYPGLVTEILTEVVEGSSIRLTEQVLPYRRLYRGLRNREFHSWVGYGSPSWLAPEIKQHTWFSSTPLFSARYQLAGLAPAMDEPLLAEGFSIIVIDGYRYGGRFNQWVAEQGHALVAAPSHAHALAMLRQGRGDLYVAEEVRIHWEAMRSGRGLYDLALYDFSAVIPDADVFLTADAELPASVLQTLEARLAALDNKGALRRVYDRYLQARFY